jgi:hypothetical protein
MNTIPTKAGRDPVCEAIESLLRDLEAEGRGQLNTFDTEDSVRVTFGDFSACAFSRDIALVRLAKAMIDDDRYCAVLMDTLRKPMLAGG